jgi:hypothetical protein
LYLQTLRGAQLIEQRLRVDFGGIFMIRTDLRLRIPTRASGKHCKVPQCLRAAASRLHRASYFKRNSLHRSSRPQPIQIA